MFFKELNKRLTPAKVLRVARWSVGLALFFAVGERLLGLAEDGNSAIQSATNGAMLGAIMVMAQESIVTRWAEGAIVGAIFGALGGMVWWAAMNVGLVAAPRGEPPSFMSVVSVLTLVYALGGVILSWLFVPRSGRQENG